MVHPPAGFCYDGLCAGMGESMLRLQNMTCGAAAELAHPGCEEEGDPDGFPFSAEAEVVALAAMGPSFLPSAPVRPS